MPQSAWMLARLLCFSKLLSRVGVEFCVVCSFVACCTFKFFLFCRAKLHGKSMETRVLDESNLLCEHILSNDAKPFVSEVGVNDIICLACFEPQCIPSTLNRQWFCDKIDAVPDFLENVWFSDEAHFLLSGHVNSKNNIFWGSTPPEHCLQRPLHSMKCTAWVAISKHGIIGPFWCEDNNERSVTINTERSVQVLGKFWTALGRRRGVVKVLQ